MQSELQLQTLTHEFEEKMKMVEMQMVRFDVSHYKTMELYRDTMVEQGQRIYLYTYVASLL